MCTPTHPFCRLRSFLAVCRRFFPSSPCSSPPSPPAPHGRVSVKNRHSRGHAVGIPTVRHHAAVDRPELHPCRGPPRRTPPTGPFYDSSPTLLRHLAAAVGLAVAAAVGLAVAAATALTAARAATAVAEWARGPLAAQRRAARTRGPPHGSRISSRPRGKHGRGDGARRRFGRCS